MKIVEAVWEKRNLGMDAYEISLTKKDLADVDNVLNFLRQQNFQNCYVVIKLPVGNLKILHALEDEGYRFMETQFEMKDYFQPYEDDDIIKELKNSCVREVVPKTREAWEEIISRITPGMFDTDRISLDQNFGPEVACKRYQNWCRDLFDNPDSYMWILKSNDDIVSFSVCIYNRQKEQDEGVIGGVFENQKGNGFGLLQAVHQCDFVHPTRTTVSSNNLTVLKIYQKYGTIIIGEKYVLSRSYPSVEV